MSISTEITGIIVPSFWEDAPSPSTLLQFFYTS